MEGASSRVEQVYRSDAATIWRALVGFSGSREIADDAVAEAFARALHHDGAIRDPRAWVWRVGRGSELRARSRFDEPEVITSPEPVPDVPDLVDALRRLPEHQRLALVLHDYADRPTPEVGAIIGCSAATVYVHLSRGRRRLRALLEVSDA